MLTRRMSKRIDEVLEAEKQRKGKFISKEGFVNAALLLVVTNEALLNQALALNEYLGNLGREQLERLEEKM